MKVCPECGYVEPFEWRATTWHATQGNECCRLTDLMNLNKELAEELKAKFDVPGKYTADKTTVVKKHYAYRISKTGVWVIRRWIEIYKIQGWKDIPAERRKPAKDNNQQKLIVSSEQSPETAKSSRAPEQCLESGNEGDGAVPWRRENSVPAKERRKEK